MKIFHREVNFQNLQWRLSKISLKSSSKEFPTMPMELERRKPNILPCEISLILGKWNKPILGFKIKILTVKRKGINHSGKQKFNFFMMDANDLEQLKCLGRRYPQQDKFIVTRLKVWANLMISCQILWFWKFFSFLHEMFYWDISSQVYAEVWGLSASQRDSKSHLWLRDYKV